ncbi:hypothetical protein PHAVU_005G005500 [Phaseolus vulgaris]|uniref:Glycosyltransferase n=1 Tax=Phaseolus vulgaris TaxID=3885 RepID=V7BRP5_PHAVU|nr:hypothetical protein PHAVU_005G005500g [Phaseolus vulgaris]ESW20672.1 hypothetical protein PHAVU_005G005500g [Phaseolus vulgaris]
MEEESIVMFPSVGIGHIVAMVELAKLIQTHRFSITILLITGVLDHPSIDAYIRRISALHPSISFLRLPRTTPATFTTAASFAEALSFSEKNAPHVAATLTQISKTATVKAFVIDLFCANTMDSASSMGIPVYFFFTSGAAVLALYSYFPKLHQESSVSFKDMVGVELHVPGNAPLKAVDLPKPILDRDDPTYWYMLEFCTRMATARGIIVNSFEELEPAAVNAVAQGACFPDPTRAPRIHYIGPLLAEPQQSDGAAAGTDKKECLRWLDEQPSRSVVYLCFGSQGSFSVSQLGEIAKGLERSGKRFLWVVKKPLEEDGAKQGQELAKTGDEFDLPSVLPDGFLERTKDRGMVVKAWAPQVEVLSRDSVGGFVSHCGWNSVLEGVVAGVPMVAWPLYAEQHVNREVMVGEMKVAVAVKEREEDGLVSGEEVEKRVREVMENKKIRETSLKLKHMAMAAVSEFGSSTTSLANLLHSWI